MKTILAALMAAVSCAATVQAQEAPNAPSGAVVLTLDDAVAEAGGSAPAMDAGRAGIDAAKAGRTVAGLRPNPVAQGQIENIIGTGPYSGVRSNETTVGFMQTLELGGKRSARVAVASAELSRAELQAAVIAADVRLQVTQLYVEAISAERRLITAKDQARIAGDALRAAGVRVQAGRASPLERQRADVARVNAEANAERQDRLARAARTNLERRIGRAFGPLDVALLDRLPAASASYGPSEPVSPQGTLALAAADADLAIADAGVRLAKANRVPNIDVGPSVRRLEATKDFAAVFAVSIPLQVFNNGGAALAQAGAQRTQAEANRRLTALDIEQAITNAQADADNAATTARAASGPALQAAQEAARIARIGYREGKFSQLDLLDAERTLADTRVAAIDALASYQNARAQLERLTAPAVAPQGGN
ncbi:TolC family protein [Sphingobium sp.]|uniref:TolC family protein n=1 Tax=Sphingobium sp. TaxID=1912891 RepID=UPI002BB80F65|nr:TolC family protein [Sphingobium sp.]HUD95598.1 TolC family protein [Sphingobium sp.]